MPFSQDLLYVCAEGSRPCQSRRGPTPGAIIDTPSQPLYTHAHVPFARSR